MAGQVITEYKKARGLMAENAASPKGGVWQSLFHEVEKVCSLICTPDCYEGPLQAHADAAEQQPSLAS